MAFEQFQTQVLLLHSEQNTLDVLSSGFSDRYTVHCATSGIEALNTLGVTPIDVIVSAQDLPGMSGIDALREAKKRSPETIAILMAGTDTSDGIEAVVGDKEVFQIIRGEIAPDALFDLVESATKSARLVTLSESANDRSANVDSGPGIEKDEDTASSPSAFDDLKETGEHIVMETAENGSCMISDGTGELPVLKQELPAQAAKTGTRKVELLALTQDDDFLTTVREATKGMHKVHHATQPGQAVDFVRNFAVGVLVTDAAMAGTDVEDITRQLRQQQPRLVAIVAGRRDDGDMLMDLINRGQVYRFLLKPVSPGRARLAIEASVKHHLDGPEHAFQSRPGPRKLSMPPPQPVRTEPKIVADKPVAAGGSPESPASKPAHDTRTAPAPARPPDGLDNAFDEANSFTETMTGIAVSIGKSVTVAAKSVLGSKEQAPDPASPRANASAGKPAKPPAKAPDARQEPALRRESPEKNSARAKSKVGIPLSKDTTPGTGQVAGEGVDFDRTRRSKDFKPTSDTERYAPARDKADAPASMELPQSDPFAGSGGGFRLPSIPVLAGIGAVAAAAIAIGWFMLGEDDAPATRPATQTAAPTQRPALQSESADSTPAAVNVGEQSASDRPLPSPEPDTGDAATAGTRSPQVAALVERASQAVENGDLFAPAGQNGVELLLRARSMDPANAELAEQLDSLLGQVYSEAETALLENRTQDASRALRVIGLADPDSARLGFLAAQLDQQQLRLTLDNARDAIREGRFEDAGRLLVRADSFAAGNRGEIEALSAELDSRRNDQQLGDVLELAAQRLANNQLLRPANDNARYYYELANSIDPGSAAAEQGLVTIAGRLVLRARTAIDNGDFDSARSLLDDAKVLDPASEEVLAANAALDAAREAAVSEAISYDSVQPRRESATSAAAARPAQAELQAASASPDPVNEAEPGGNLPAPQAASEESSAQQDPVTQTPVADEQPAGAIEPAAVAEAEEAPALAMLTRNETPAGDASDVPAAGSLEPEPATTESNALPEIKLVSITELNRTRYVAPKYPRSAERRQLSGFVDLIFTVTPLGTVSDIEVRNSEPGDAFIDSAMESVENWEFEPVTEGGVAVPRRVAVRLTFNFE